MRIIDERGMVFGKINIIDFLVVLFVLCLLPMFYFGYKIINRPQEIIQKPPTITLDKVAYEQEQMKLENFLKENKRVRKYFE